MKRGLITTCSVLIGVVIECWAAPTRSEIAPHAGHSVSSHRRALTVVDDHGSSDASPSDSSSRSSGDKQNEEPQGSGLDQAAEAEGQNVIGMLVAQGALASVRATCPGTPYLLSEPLENDDTLNLWTGHVSFLDSMTYIGGFIDFTMAWLEVARAVWKVDNYFLEDRLFMARDGDADDRGPGFYRKPIEEHTTRKRANQTVDENGEKWYSMDWVVFPNSDRETVVQALEPEIDHSEYNTDNFWQVFVNNTFADSQEQLSCLWDRNRFVDKSYGDIIHTGTVEERQILSYAMLTGKKAAVVEITPESDAEELSKQLKKSDQQPMVLNLREPKTSQVVSGYDEESKKWLLGARTPEDLSGWYGFEGGDFTIDDILAKGESMVMVEDDNVD